MIAGELTPFRADLTVTAELPVVRGPVATLLNVHTLVVVSHAVVVLVRTNIVVPENATLAVTPVPPVQATVGLEARKKLLGKVMVMGSAPTPLSAVSRAKVTVTTAVEKAAAALARRCAAVMSKVNPWNLDNKAGNSTKLTPSMLLLLASNVETVTPVVAAAAAAAFLSPANWHTIVPVFACGVPMESTRVLEPDNEAVPAARPVQVSTDVG